MCVQHMDSIELQKDSAFINALETAISKEGPFSNWELFSMAFQAELTTSSPSFNGLRALEYLPHVNFLDHQTDVAEQAIRYVLSHCGIDLLFFDSDL